MKAPKLLEQTRQFLNHLYPDGIPKSQHLLLWTIPGKTSYWFTDTDSASESLDLMGQKNIYIGCGLSPQDFGASRRAPAKDISGIPGLWADIDYGADGHKGKTYPPDQATALKILDDLAVRPTLVIHSGNGLQAWWLWDKPWIFADEADHTRATDVSKAWGEILIQAGGDYSVDSVSDLSRVLRVPGSENVKDPNLPKPVRMLIQDGPRWKNHETFIKQAGIDITVEALAPSKKKPSKVSANIPKGDPPGAKMTILWSVDPQARDAWIGEPAPWLKDQSDSSRDLSIATRAAMAGWNDLELGQLLRAGREHRGADLKHPGYYDLTIRKASENSNKPLHIREADEALGIDPDSATPEARLEKISELIGVDPAITKLTKTDGDPVVYRMYWKGRKMELGDGGGILEQSKFRRIMFDLAGVVVPRRKAPEWDKIAQMFANCVTVLEVGAEGEATTQVEQYLESYFEAFGGDLSVEWKVRAQEREPFIKTVGQEDRLYFTLTGSQGLSTFVWSNYAVRPNATKFAGILRELGWSPEKMVIRNGDDVFKRSLWFKTVGAKS